MKQTKNFFLKLFEGKDKFDYNVINENIQTIDDLLKKLPSGTVTEPTIKVDVIENGFRLTITDSTGTHEHDLILPSGTGVAARIKDVTLYADGWVAIDDERFEQIVDIDGTTKNSDVEIRLTDEQIVVFREKDLTFMTENDNGVITFKAIGQKPQNDYTIQVKITEVLYE